jgi:hypothetical protein
MTTAYSLNKIQTAKNSAKHHVIYDNICLELSTIDILKYIKIYKGHIKASNVVDLKKEPCVKIGEPNIVGLQLLIDVESKVVQFFAITSATKGYGDKMVSSVIRSVPDDWKIIVFMDFSHGFWTVMSDRYPRLIVV